MGHKDVIIPVWELHTFDTVYIFLKNTTRICVSSDNSVDENHHRRSLMRHGMKCIHSGHVVQGQKAILLSYNNDTKTYDLAISDFGTKRQGRLRMP